jgi:ABC-type anion transport system duplicated permease subunit
MLRLNPAPEPRPAFASVIRQLSRLIWQLLKDLLRLGAVLALLYLLAVFLGVFR